MYLRALYRVCISFLSYHRRHFSLQEFHCKNLMLEHNINVQRFELVKQPSDIQYIKDHFKVNEYVVKAQIPCGGRGRGIFADGFKGGIHLTKNPLEMEKLVLRMLGKQLKTRQTGPEGMVVNNVMIAEAMNIKREMYFAILMDLKTSSSIIVACKEGGMDIEELAVNHPESILREPINVNTGITDQQAHRIATLLGFVPESHQHMEACKQFKHLYKLFTSLDCVQVEINPLGETNDGQVICFDAKLSFDRNALYRHQDIQQMIDEVTALQVAAAGPTSIAALEADASNNGLTYIGLPHGNIGCIVNGAGLAMATMDLIHTHGGKPANFLDLGGSVSVNQVEKAFDLITRDPRINCILVNIFGGIVNCEIVSSGLINAFRQHKPNIPIVVRLEGTNAEQARVSLSESDTSLIPAETLEEAASLIVSKAA